MLSWVLHNKILGLKKLIFTIITSMVKLLIQFVKKIAL